MNPQDAAIPQAPAEENAMGGAEESRSALAETRDKLAQSARDAAARIKSAASDTATQARDRAGHIATEKKETAASRLGDYSSAIHESARSLEEKDPNIAWFTHRAADRLQRTADYVRSRDLSGLRDDAERIARRHPAVFFGGMFLAGLLLGNLVKASRRKLEAGENSGELTASEAGGDWIPSAEQPPAELPISAPSAQI